MNAPKDPLPEDFNAAELPDALPPDHRSGYVAVIGRPNVGKSTLLNRMLGQKLAIVTPKPQTTRDPILGIVTQPDAQMLFLDTPGIHKPLHKLGEYMVAVAQETLADADVVLWLVDGSAPPTDEDILIADMLRQVNERTHLRAIVLGLNKCDLHPGRQTGDLGPHAEAYRSLLTWWSTRGHALTVVSLSGMTGTGADGLLKTLRDLLPVGPRYYPEDEITDVQTRFVVAELIREQALLQLGEEVPHSIAVEVDEFSERNPGMTYISAVLYVERETQKAIVLGKGGRTIKRIGQAARPQIEELVGTRVFLELWVKVWERWRKREETLRRLGYAVEKR